MFSGLKIHFRLASRGPEAHTVLGRDLKNGNPVWNLVMWRNATRKSFSEDPGDSGSLIPPMATSTEASSRLVLLASICVLFAQVSLSGQVFGPLPLSFEENRGQTDQSVRFLARGPGYTIFLTDDETVLRLDGAPPVSRRESLKYRRLKEVAARSDAQPTVVRMKLVGAAATARFTTGPELEGKSNYFIGNDPAQWRTGIPNFARVGRAGVYPGIDVLYYGAPHELECDFVVAPGADPSVIHIVYEGIQELSIDEAGDLILSTPAGPLRQHAPKLYREVQGRRRAVAGRYVLAGDKQVRFQVGASDALNPLVIDPVLSYSTYLSGSGADTAAGVAVDASGNMYVAGTTASTDFTVTPGAYQTYLRGSSTLDVFVLKVNPSGTALVYSTYLGGGGDDYGAKLAVDSSGSVYVTGFTTSTTFPTTPGSFQTYTSDTCCADGFVTKLNPAGSALVYSTYLSGSADDMPEAVAIDSSGNAYVAGVTDSTTFSRANGFQTTGKGSGDAFVAKLNPSGSDLTYFTFLGGTGTDEASAIAVDSGGNAYVTGITGSSDFPVTAAAVQKTFGGAKDAFVAKLSPTAGLVYSTFLGGSGEDSGFGIAVNASGVAYVAGRTASTNFPTTSSAPQKVNKGGANDAFVAKLNPDASSLLFSTYLGGSGDDRAYALALGPDESVYIAGSTSSTDLPGTSGAVQASFGGGSEDMLIAKLDSSGTVFQAVTYLGGSGLDDAFDIAVDSQGAAYITGQTESYNFPTTSGALQTRMKASLAAVLVRLTFGGPTPPTISTASPLPAGTVGAFYSQTLTATGGTGSYSSWSVISGTLPAGLSLSAGGTISGTPTAVGTSILTIQVTDSSGSKGSQQFALTVNSGGLVIDTPSSLLGATVGAPYSLTLTAHGGSGTYSAWTQISGALPVGLGLSVSGVISGTPLTAGTAAFTIQVTDSAGATASKQFSLTISIVPGTAPTINTPATLTSGSVGGAYSLALNATGGTAPYTWSLTSGALPAGLALSSAGVIAGTPTTAGNSSFTVRVADNASAAATQTFSLTVIGGGSFARAGTLSHIAAGGGWDTTISLINTSSAPVAVRLVFHADDGSALSLPLNVTQQGATQSVTAATLDRLINPNTTLTIDAGLQLATTVVGWADVLSTGPVCGFAIFRLTCPTCTASEGTVPLQSQFQSTLIVPYDNTANFVTGVALANLSSTQASITATIWDENGNQLGTPTITVAGSGHTAFVLSTKFPLTIGNRGIVQFQNPSGGALDGLGLRFSPYGTFTSVPTIPSTPPPASAPQITSLNPASGQAGNTVAVVISGSNLAGVTAVQFSPSTGITVSNVNAAPTQVTATVTIAASAAAGSRSVFVSSPAGTSNTLALAFAIQTPSPAPQITSLNPTSGQAGTGPFLFISGSNLSGVTSVQFSPSTGIVGTVPQGPTIFGTSTSTDLITTLSIDSSAAPGPRNVTVSSPAGTSNSLVYTILAPSAPPQITSLNPASGQAGNTVVLAISGANLSGVTSVQFSPSTGVTVSNVNATATQVTATVTIAASAAAGSRSVSVSSPAGTSSSLAFTIQQPPPPPPPSSYDGQWNGTTSQGRAMSMTVAGNNVTAYSYGVNFPNLGASCPTGVTTTSGPATSIPITGSSFSTSTFSGTFQSLTQASGTVNWTLSLPGCTASGTGTWSATKQ